jgi:hypothetical protein
MVSARFRSPAPTGNARSARATPTAATAATDAWQTPGPWRRAGAARPAAPPRIVPATCRAPRGTTTERHADSDTASCPAPTARTTTWTRFPSATRSEPRRCAKKREGARRSAEPMLRPGAAGPMARMRGRSKVINGRPRSSWSMHAWEEGDLRSALEPAPEPRRRAARGATGSQKRRAALPIKPVIRPTS